MFKIIGYGKGNMVVCGDRLCTFIYSEEDSAELMRDLADAYKRRGMPF